jgi:hypothetical protein
MPAGVKKMADDTLVLLLATGRPVADAASEVKVSERTVRRRLADPAFRQRVGEIRNQLMQETVGRLADGMMDAAQCLRDLLRAEGESVRLNAARVLLEMGLRLREHLDLRQEIDELRQEIEEIMEKDPNRAV